MDILQDDFPVGSYKLTGLRYTDPIRRFHLQLRKWKDRQAK